jgi:hypothetical protein
MKVKICRSSGYLREKTIETGQNQPRTVEVEVSPSLLSEEARRIVVDHNSGIFPSTIDDIQERHSGHFFSHNFESDVELEDIGHGLIEELIVKAFASVNAEVEEMKAKTAMLAQEEQARKEAGDAAFAERAAAFLADPTALVFSVKFFEKHPMADAVLEEQKRRKEAHETEQTERRKLQNVAWLSEYGTQSQRERYARGLLDEQEIVDGLTEIEFSRFDDGIERFVRLKKADLSRAIDSGYDDDTTETECSYKRRDFENEDPLPASVFDALAKIEDRAEDCNVDIELHQTAVYWSTSDWPELRRWKVVARKIVGIYTLKREYMLPGVEDWVAMTSASTATKPNA